MNNIEIVDRTTEKIYIGYLNLLARSRSLSHCKQNLFLIKMTLWRTELERCLSGILKGEFVKNRTRNIEDQCIAVLKEHSDLANSKVVDFFFNFHKQFACSYVKYINNIIADKNKSKLEKFAIVADEFLELMNITLIELESMKVDCCIFQDDSDSCQKSRECNECKDVDNVIFLRIIPEYFLFDGIFDKLIEAFSMIKHPEKVILIVSYKMMCNRLEYYNWQERGAYNRYLKVKDNFKKVYFYDYQRCVDFNGYEKELKENGQLIENKQQLYRIVDDWREEQGKKRIYQDKYEPKEKIGVK